MEDLNCHKGSFYTTHRSKHRQISVFQRKIVHKVSDSVLVVFTKCENTGIESFFCFTENQVIENLSAICEPFLTTSVAGRETTPPRAAKAAVNDLCGL